MPITNQDSWQKWVDANTDPYGGACVKVARRAMEILDEEPGAIEPWKLISRADDETATGGITGFMAGCVAQMISQCHSRGEEFRMVWNKETQLGTEGDKANAEGGVLNPAILNVARKQ